MKAKHAEYEKFIARTLLRNINAHIGQDFHTLRDWQVDALLVEADRVKYRKPKSANGSRARYFYALVQRRAK